MVGFFFPQSFFFFWCGSFKKFFLLNLLWYCFCYILFFLAKRHVGSLYPDWRSNLNPCIGRQSLNHWIAREVPPHMPFPRLLKGVHLVEKISALFCVVSGSSVVKNPSASAGDVRDVALVPWIGKIPWRRRWQSAPVFLPGKSHGQRSLAGYSPRGRKRVGRDSATEPACTRLLLKSLSQWSICEWTPLLSAPT